MQPRRRIYIDGVQVIEAAPTMTQLNNFVVVGDNEEAARDSRFDGGIDRIGATPRSAD